jgi:hypothetical protein
LSWRLTQEDQAAGIKVGSVAELVSKLKTEAGVL